MSLDKPEPSIELNIDTFIDKKETATHALTLLSQWVDDKSKSDVVFKVGNYYTGVEDIYGIRTLFCKHSPVFERMLSSNTWIESSNSCKNVIIQDIAPQTFRWLKSYIYGCNPQLTPQNAIDIMTLSDKYMIQPLYNACCNYIEKTCQTLANKEFVAKNTLESLCDSQYYLFPLQAMRRMHDFGHSLDLALATGMKICIIM